MKFAFLPFVALLSCSRDLPMQPTDCTPYAGDVELLTACVIQHARRIQDATAAMAACDQLPAPRNLQCRARWVDTAADSAGHSRADLLTVCGAAPDCAFLVLDTRPEGTYTEQVAECDALTGHLAEDCAGHAAQRLLSLNPSDAELRAAVAAPHGRSLNSMLPDYMLRSGHASCPDLGSVTAACSAALHALRAKGASPAPPAYTPGPPGPRDGR